MRHAAFMKFKKDYKNKGGVNYKRIHMYEQKMRKSMFLHDGAHIQSSSAYH